MIVATHGIVASQILTVPVATAATSVGDSSFTANWNAYSGAVYYLLDVSLNSSFSSYVLQDKVVYSTSYSVTGLASNTTYYYRVRASTEYDTDASAFFSRVTTAGGSLTTTEQQAVNSLVLDLKSYSIWSKMQAIYPMVGASADACKQNLKSSSFTGSFSSGWTFASTGVTPNGTSAYMDTNFAPASNLTLSSAHNSVYLRTNLAISSTVAFGVEQATLQRMVLFPYAFSVGWISDLFDNTVSRLTSSSGPSTGFVLASRSSSSSHKLFRNSTQLASSTSATTGTLPTLNYYIGGFNANGSPSFFSTNQIAFYSLGDGLTDTEAGNFYTAVNAFQVSLSRNV